LRGYHGGGSVSSEAVSAEVNCSDDTFKPQIELEMHALQCAELELKLRAAAEGLELSAVPV
jgi:hypothetical protein